MKRLFLLLGITGFAGAIFAGDFKSAIITTSPLMINVADDHSLHIRNFTQEGGTERGVVTVVINGQTANILNAAIIDNTAAASPTPTPTPTPTPSPTVPPETINEVVVAGPATVTIPVVPGATLFITYRQIKE
jgi:hypothetical protein